MADETNPPMAQLLDFSNAMCAGCGFTRLNDERGRKFDENLRSGEFAKSGLQQVAETLMENIRRLCSHAKMPYQIFNYGRRFHDVYLRFYAEPAVNKSEIMSDDEVRHFQAAKRTWNWILGQEPHDCVIGLMTGGNDVAGFAIAPEPVPEIQRTKATQINAFCASLVIEAWALFESLGEDLWEAALNFHPTVLGSLKGSPRSKYKMQRNDISRQGASQATFRMSFDDLQRSEFNVRNCVGTILKRNDNIGFRSIYDIRASYHRAFDRQNKTIDDILDDPGLQYAAAVRNIGNEA